MRADYLGEFDGAFSPSGGLFSRAAESMGSPVGPENTFEHALSINSLVVQGVLRISWSYDRNRYEEETIRRLASRYQHTLSEVIAHCKGVEEPIKTASDYGLPTTVSQSELEAFKAEERHPAAIEDLYPLSPLQEGLLFHSLYDSTGEAYQVHFSCDFKGGLEGQAFRKAWQQLSEKHSILRTAFFPEALSYRCRWSTAKWRFQ